MSRISRYQKSMEKFIKDKSYINHLDGSTRLLFKEMDYDNIISIVVIAIMNVQSKKNNISTHAYYIITGIELLLLLSKINDNNEYYKNKIGMKNIDKLYKLIPSIVNICLNQNIDYIQTKIKKEKSLKMYINLGKIINDKMVSFLCAEEFNKDENKTYIEKSDITKYNFDNLNNPKEKLKKLKKRSKENMIEYMSKKYGLICQIGVICGWMLGGSYDEKMLSELEKMGLYLGNIYKLSNDFMNLERDLKSEKEYSNNYVINNGIQDSFEMFIDNKIKLIEMAMLIGIYNNNIILKEIIDIIEKNMEVFLDKTTADLRSQYTLGKSSTEL